MVYCVWGRKSSWQPYVALLSPINDEQRKGVELGGEGEGTAVVLRITAIRMRTGREWVLSVFLLRLARVAVVMLQALYDSYFWFPLFFSFFSLYR